MPSDASAGSIGRAIAAIPSCALDAAGRREQQGRYTRLAASVARVERHEDAIVLSFDQRLDRETLEQAIAVEQECCPFFVFQMDERSRRLRVAVCETQLLPALEVLAAAFGKADSPRSEGGD